MNYLGMAMVKEGGGVKIWYLEVFEKMCVLAFAIIKSSSLHMKWLMVQKRVGKLYLNVQSDRSISNSRSADPLSSLMYSKK